MATRKLRIIAPLASTVAGLVMGVPANAAGAGGAPAPSASGGTEFGAAVSARARRAARPTATVFKVAPRRITAGATPPQIVVRIDQRGVRAVRARVVFWPLRGKGRVLRLDLGRLRTGRRVEAHWPAGAALSAGRYVVRLHARGPGGGTLLRRAHHAGRAPLTVSPAPPPPAPPVAAPLTPITPGGVFPVAGPHSFGGDSARFGAARDGHAHQGQDIMAAEGTPVVAPLAGTIIARDYQADGAGFYLVEQAVDGRHFFFAHCQKDTFAVDVGAAVGGGQQLCRVGSTGRSSGAHLHFEIWIGGWHVDQNSHPIDPLPDLQAWDAAATAG
jgi:murein DD-endopeptidase MepM/ murein hydrolase activator NlpD